MESQSEVLVWRSARLASQLIESSLTSVNADCGCITSSSSSSSLLSVRLHDRRAAAGLLCLDWACASTPTRRHSKWIDETAVAPVHRVANGNALLGRGSHEMPFEDENDRRLALFASRQLGRIVAAVAPIPRGTCALRATAFAVVVADRSAARQCHWCFSTLSKKAFRCADCEFALYCSRECLQTDAVLHDPQCTTLRQLQATVRPSPPQWIDNELLRLTLAVLSMEAFVQNTQALSKLTVSVIAVATANDASRLGQHRALDTAVAFLYKSLTKNATTPPPLRSVTRAHIRETIQKLQSNAHPLALNGSSGVCGLGIFPEAAMTVNHSCSPNVVPTFDPQTRSLGFFAIQNIAPMELIEYSYLADLSVGRARRQETLRDGFGFDCVCARCELEGLGTMTTTASSSSSSVADPEDTELLTRLMEWSTTQNVDPLEVAGKLRELETRHTTLLQSRLDLQFSLKMLDLRCATRVQDLRRVITIAETLLELWRLQGLPAFYATTETLHLQIFQAATRLGDTQKVNDAKCRVQEIQRVCGGVQLE